MMAIVKTMAVTLKNGAKAVINVSDFDPAVHTVEEPKKKKAADDLRRGPRKKFSTVGAR